MPIAGFEVYDKLRAIAEQFGPNALPIDYLDAKPDSIDPHSDNRMFVQQLRVIDVESPESRRRFLITIGPLSSVPDGRVRNCWSATKWNLTSAD